MLKKEKLKQDLKKQIEEKERLQSYERIYLDKKQLAVNKGQFKSVSPEIFGRKNGIDLEQDEKYLD